jgi:hypothetical protein
MSLESLNLTCMLLTMIGVALALIATWIVWIDRRHVKRHGSPKEYEFACQVFWGKIIILSAQGLLLYERGNLMSGLPVVEYARDAQYRGTIILMILTLMFSARSLTYMLSRKRILDC